MTIDLDQLEAAAKAANPGPWTDEHNDRLDRHFVNCRNGSKQICECQEWAKESIKGQANAAFIAAANPATVLELVTELRRQRKTMQRLARALRLQNRARGILQRECKHAQDRAARAVQELEEWKERNTLRWTSEPPTVPGWYWNRVAGKETIPVWLYYDSNGEFYYQVAGLPDDCWLVESLADEPGCEWAGPIPEPEEK